MSKNRREFLRASAAVAGVASSISMAGAFAAGNETIKVGLIGCGGRGTGAVVGAEFVLVQVDHEPRAAAGQHPVPARGQRALVIAKRAHQRDQPG